MWPTESIEGASAAHAQPMKMKGIGFTHVRAYEFAHHGAEGLLRVAAQLSADDRAVLQDAVPVGWYDVHVFARLLRAIDTVHGRGDLGSLGAIGAFEAEQDFSRVFRVFLRALSPYSMLHVEEHLWRHLQDSGIWHSQPFPNGIRATLSGWAADQALCVERIGYLRRLLEFTGGRNVSVSHEQCRAEGQRACVFTCRWA